MKLKYINQNYIPKGQLEGFPLEIIDKIIEKQVEQGNEANVEVFEDNITIDRDLGGFDWIDTEEGREFWLKVINNKEFNLFFKKYPKEDKELPLPRVIEVKCEGGDDFWVKRVCIKIINGEAVCWDGAETLEEAENEKYVTVWEQWREVQEESKPEYKPFDFSDGIKNHLDLIGKKIFSKDNNYVVVVDQLGFNSVFGQSLINGIDTEYVCKHYFFEDGSPVGIKIEDK